MVEANSLLRSFDVSLNLSGDFVVLHDCGWASCNKHCARQERSSAPDRGRKRRGHQK
ncbi:hypothetical protein [Bartonella acomydis]|uniref:hypothetical protein n=1 Tax=Bartonella acomydis TaxID=686234 RepID=UPI0031F0758B